MVIREKMSRRFTLYPRTTPIRQVVSDADSGHIEFYVVVQNGADLAVTFWPALHAQISALSDDFGPATLDMTLADVGAAWTPVLAVSAEGDAEQVLEQFKPGEARPVVEGQQVIGVLANPSRAMGSSTLTTMYGSRYALFADDRPSRPSVERMCPVCGRGIEAYKPMRIGTTIERHCPHCDALIMWD